MAFLDDNGTVDPSDESSQGPDKGDLVSMEGFGTPKVTIDQAGEVMVTVDLNVQMPF